MPSTTDDRGRGRSRVRAVRTSGATLSTTGARRALARATNTPSRARPDIDVAVCALAAIELSSAAESTSWKAPVPSSACRTAPGTTTTGAPSIQASRQPTTRWVAPGPFVAMTAAGRPASLPNALAIRAALPSCRTVMTCRPPFLRAASNSALIDSAGRPKMTSTPCSTRLSTTKSHPRRFPAISLSSSDHSDTRCTSSRWIRAYRSAKRKR
jgi:hypothetical protein